MPSHGSFSAALLSFLDYKLVRPGIIICHVDTKVRSVGLHCYLPHIAILFKIRINARG